MDEAVVVKRWWGWVVRGLIAIAFGIVALALTYNTAKALVWLFGVFFLAYGFVSLIVGIWASVKKQGGTALIVGGALAVIVGIITLVWPSATGLVLMFLIGIWAILMGAAMIAEAFTLPVKGWGVWLLGLSGLVSVLIGLYFIINPGSGAKTFIWLIGIYALVVGVLSTAFGIFLRSAGVKKVVVNE